MPLATGAPVSDLPSQTTLCWTPRDSGPSCSVAMRRPWMSWMLSVTGSSPSPAGVTKRIVVLGLKGLG